MAVFMLGLIFVLLLGMCFLSYWGLTAYWYWFTDANNQVAFGAVIALVSAAIGALFGALGGGAFSLVGGIKGARKNLKLITEAETEKATRKIIIQLKPLLKYLKSDEKLKVSPESCFLSPDWYDDLARAKFKLEEPDKLMQFFHRWELLIKASAARERFEDIKEITEVLTESVPEIEKIIVRYRKSA